MAKLKFALERLRVLLAWPFLVVGMPFMLVARKIGGEGIALAIADTWEQLTYDGEYKQARPFKPEADEARPAFDTDG